TDYSTLLLTYLTSPTRHSSDNFRVPLVPQFVVALQSVEQFIDRDTFLLRPDEWAAAVLLGGNFPEPMLLEALGFVMVLLCGVERLEEHKSELLLTCMLFLRFLL